jgi:hypothetical protein
VLNQECDITLDAYPDHHYAAYVAKIVPTADRSKATVMVKIGFRSYDSKVLPEMSAKVAFFGDKQEKNAITDQGQKLTIPVTAIVKKNGKSFVFKIVNEQVQETEIQTGNSFGSYTEVKSGLLPGEKIVDGPPATIQNNQKIKIKE